MTVHPVVKDATTTLKIREPIRVLSGVPDTVFGILGSEHKLFERLWTQIGIIRQSSASAQYYIEFDSKLLQFDVFYVITNGKKLIRLGRIDSDDKLSIIEAGYAGFIEFNDPRCGKQSLYLRYKAEIYDGMEVIRLLDMPKNN